MKKSIFLTVFAVLAQSVGMFAGDSDQYIFNWPPNREVDEGKGLPDTANLEAYKQAKHEEIEGVFAIVAHNGTHRLAFFPVTYSTIIALRNPLNHLGKGKLISYESAVEFRNELNCNLRTKGKGFARSKYNALFDESNFGSEYDALFDESGDDESGDDEKDSIPDQVDNTPKGESSSSLWPSRRNFVVSSVVVLAIAAVTAYYYMVKKEALKDQKEKETKE